MSAQANDQLIRLSPARTAVDRFSLAVACSIVLFAGSVPTRAWAVPGGAKRPISHAAPSSGPVLVLKPGWTGTVNYSYVGAAASKAFGAAVTQKTSIDIT